MVYNVSLLHPFLKVSAIIAIFYKNSNENYRKIQDFLLLKDFFYRQNDWAQCRQWSASGIGVHCSGLLYSYL